MSDLTVVIEGESDLEMARTLVEHCGHHMSKFYVAGGKKNLDSTLQKYNEASRRSTWLILRDSDGKRPVELRSHLLEKFDVAPGFHLRIVHPMSEAWLLADADGAAKYFAIRKRDIPRDVDSLLRAKQKLLQLCAKSRSKGRDGMVKGDRPGPLYVTYVKEFFAERWNVESAASNSPSLARAIRALSAIS